MTPATKRFRLVEVEIDSIKATYSLKDEEVLRDAKRITAIQAYRLSERSIAPNQQPVINDAVFNKAYLTLATPGTDQVQYKIPFSDMCKADNNGQLYYVDIPPLAPTKCEISIPTNAGVVLQETFLLGFHYES